MIRLALGTAQFGLAYGISNAGGKTPGAEVTRILSTARSAGLDTLDTAMAYGDSESRLGIVGVADWKVVTKLPPMPPAVEDVDRWVLAQVKGSLARLQLKRLYGLLLHQPKDLFGSRGLLLAEAVKNLQLEGHVEKIGVSVYGSEELKSIVTIFSPDLVQLPFSPVDQSLLRDDLLTYLQGNKIELHVRSIFLQGLLLMSSDNRPAFFNRWQTLWSRWDEWLADHNLNPVTACVNFALAQKQIQRVVVGVESVSHLQQILEQSTVYIPPVPRELQSSDPDLINPSRWHVE